MNSFWLEVGRPLLASLLIPPVPFFGTLLVGLALLRRRPQAARIAIGGSIALLWLTSTVGFARLLAPALLEEFPAISAQRMDELRRTTDGKAAIVAVGSGIFQHAPEYGADANLTGSSLERLRYAVWLSRRTGLPAAFSGGVGWAGELGASEAATAKRIAETEFGHPLRWAEGDSRDTLQNAKFSVAMLRAAGVRHIVLVTSAFHARRATRAFRREAEAVGMTVETAPVGIVIRLDDPVYDWVPTPYGASLCPTIFREWIAFQTGS